MLDLAFQPDRRSPEPVYRQLARFLREWIGAGRLTPGERLPARRELAASLGLARNTVNQAYQTLLDEGLLRAHVGQGTFVAARGLRRADPEPGDANAFASLAWEGLLARRVRGLVAPQRVASAGPVRIDFRAGRVDLASLPRAALRRAFNAALEQLDALADPPDPRGLRALREALARSLVSRGIACSADEVLVVNGAQQALDLVARSLLDPGDAVALEQPGYFGAAAAFAAHEAHPVGIGVDAEGLQTDALARVLRTRRVKLLYATPAVQSPTGVALSEPRRRALLALAETYQLPIVEDDYDGVLRLGGAASPALKNLDAAGRVIYVGTFSKALFAGLRIGYLVAPRPLLARLALARWSQDMGPNTLVQAALARLIDHGDLESHVRRVRRLYDARRDALGAALAQRMPEGTRVVPPAGGNTLWLRLPDDVDAARLHEGARAAGIAYARGELFSLRDAELAAEAARHLLLSFARIPAEEMDACVEALATQVRAARVGRRRAS